MSEDKLSEEGLREEIKNLLSWGHAHDYDDILREARADAWDEGKTAGQSIAMRRMSDEPQAPTPHNPYRKQEEA